MSELTNDELDDMCRRITTWDQGQLDSLLGQPAIDYAMAHERDVRRLADEMWRVFPLGPRWWKISRALGRVYPKNDAIRARAAEIGRGRETGRIVVQGGRLVDLGAANNA